MKLELGALLTGRAGTARELLVTLDAADPKDWSAGVGSWFIEAPDQSPAWRHFWLSAIHLRPIEGGNPVTITVAGATHEILMFALDPHHKPTPLDPQAWVRLHPCNLEEQFTVTSDAAASQLLAWCATNVVDGNLWAEPPLCGQVEPWRSLIRYRAKYFFNDRGTQ